MNKVILKIVKLLKKIIPKNLNSIRNKWIKSGEDTLITNTHFDKTKKKINSEEIQVKVKKIIEKEGYKIILLSGLYGICILVSPASSTRSASPVDEER